MSHPLQAVIRRVLDRAKQRRGSDVDRAQLHRIEEQILAEQHSRVALKLRSGGYRWEQVGAALGISPEAARELAYQAVVQATRVQKLN